MSVLFTLKQYVKMVIQNKYLPYIYQKACKKPVKKGKISFADAHRRAELAGNMKPVYQKLKNGGYDIRLYCEDIQTMPVWRMIAFMKEFMQVYAQAEYVFINSYFLRCFILSETQGNNSCTALAFWRPDEEDGV